MSEFPQIFAFYSFKGGVGRSMALLNVAYALAAKGRHVLVLDMDLEAPGVSGFLQREKEIPGFARLDMVDLVEWAKSVQLPLGSDSFPPLSDYAVSIPREKLQSIPRVFGDLGRLDIIPVDEERDYYNRLATLALNNSDQNDLVRIGSVLRAWLKNLRFPAEVPDYYGPEYERTSPFEYVLVDSRTGITETGGLCIGPLSDQLVVLTALNDQNVKGTRSFLTEVGVLRFPDHSEPAPDSRRDAAETSNRPKPSLIVASLVPSGEIEKKQERLRCVKEELGKVDLKLSYHPQLALRETIFTRDYREEYLAGEYEQLLKELLRMASDGAMLELPQALLNVTPSSEEFQNSISRMLRSAPIPDSGSGHFLGYLFSTIDVSKVTRETELLMWDQVCRTLSAGESPYRLDVANGWANLLAHWSLHSSDPEMSALRFQASLNRYGQILQDKAASQAQKAVALFNRGVTHDRRGNEEEAIADYTALVQTPDVPADQKAKALLNRGVTYGQRGAAEKAIADYTTLISLPGAPADQKAKALFNRGVSYVRCGEAEKAIADYTALIEMADAPADQKAKALLNRGIAYGQRGEADKAIDDYSALIGMPDAAADQKARALLNRGVSYGQRGEAEQAIEDFTALIAMSDAPADQKSKALFNRAVAYGKRGEVERAIEDSTALIGMPEAPPDQKADALFNRAVAYGQRGETEREFADYTAVVEMPDASTETKANALFTRGVMYDQRGEAEQAIEDFTALIGMPNASNEQKARALAGRGWTHFLAGHYVEAIADEQNAVALDPGDSRAHGNLAIALLVVGRVSEALAAYDDGLALAGFETLDGMSNDLRDAIKKHGFISCADDILGRIEARRRVLSEQSTSSDKSLVLGEPAAKS